MYFWLGFIRSDEFDGVYILIFFGYGDRRQFFWHTCTGCQPHRHLLCSLAVFCYRALWELFENFLIKKNYNWVRTARLYIYIYIYVEKWIWLLDAWKEWKIVSRKTILDLEEWEEQVDIINVWIMMLRIVAKPWYIQYSFREPEFCIFDKTYGSSPQTSSCVPQHHLHLPLSPQPHISHGVSIHHRQQSYKFRNVIYTSLNCFYFTRHNKLLLPPQLLLFSDHQKERLHFHYPFLTCFLKPKQIYLIFRVLL